MYCSLVALSSPIPFLSTKAQYIKSNRCRVIVLCLLHPYLVSILFLASSLHVNYFVRKLFITSNNYMIDGKQQFLFLKTSLNSPCFESSQFSE